MLPPVGGQAVGVSGHITDVIQLQVDQFTGEYRGYLGSPVQLDGKVGTAQNSVPRHPLRTGAGPQDIAPAGPANVLFAAPATAAIHPLTGNLYQHATPEAAAVTAMSGRLRDASRSGSFFVCRALTRGMVMSRFGGTRFPLTPPRPALVRNSPVVSISNSETMIAIAGRGPSVNLHEARSGARLRSLLPSSARFRPFVVVHWSGLWIPSLAFDGVDRRLAVLVSEEQAFNPNMPPPQLGAMLVWDLASSRLLVEDTDLSQFDTIRISNNGSLVAAFLKGMNTVLLRYVDHGRTTLLDHRSPRSATSGSHRRSIVPSLSAPRTSRPGTWTQVARH